MTHSQRPPILGCDSVPCISAIDRPYCGAVDGLSDSPQLPFQDVHRLPILPLCDKPERVTVGRGNPHESLFRFRRRTESIVKSNRLIRIAKCENAVGRPPRLPPLHGHRSICERIRKALSAIDLIRNGDGAMGPCGFQAVRVPPGRAHAPLFAT
jgi:hypothetical protein